MTRPDAAKRDQPAGTRPSPQQADIVRYWRLLELFSPQQVDKVDPANSERPIIDYSPGRPLPWDTLLPPRPVPDGQGRQSGRMKKKVWQHTVYLGVYDIEAIYEHLHAIFPRDEDAYDERPPGASACAVILVDAEGRMIEDSAVLSSALWGIGRSVSPGVTHPGWSVGLEAAQEQFAVGLAERLAPSHSRGNSTGAASAPRSGAGPLSGADNHDTDGPSTDAQSTDGQSRTGAGSGEPKTRINATVLEDLLRLAHQAAGIAGPGGAGKTTGVGSFAGIATSRVRIASTLVNADARTDSEARPDFLNSFLLEDLATVADSPWGPALQEYLTSATDVPVAQRIDVQTRPEAVIAGTRIEQLPEGRWLSSPDMHLSSSQQFAVNEAFASLGSSCHVLGVNGPPGTGKTTMLRDVLAGNVVQRAAVLAGLDSPSQAFTSTTHRWKAGDYTRQVRGLRPEVTGFEMLLASSNNGAVQNVSDELPQRKTVHDPDGVADYFADLASEIEYRQRSTAEEKRKPRTATWGLIAARLGNSTNRGNFFSAFWFGAGTQSAPTPRTPPPGTPSAIPPRHAAPGTAPSSVLGLQQLLKNWEADPATRPSWQGARASFTRARARVAALTAERQQAQSRRDLLTQAASELAAVRTRLDEADADILRHSERSQSAATTSARLASAVQAPATRHQRHLASEPSGWEKLIDRSATRAWRQTLSALEQELNAAEAAATNARDELERAQEALTVARQAREAAAGTHTRLQQQMQKLQHQVEQDAVTWGQAHPSGEWLQDSEQRELHAAWLDHELDEARSQLFLTALRLHQAWWAAVPNIRKDLQAAKDVVTGAAPRSLTSEARRAAWQLLFLIVPLVSTTFASVGRMLHGLGPHALGWLLIDEAGQATPQAAVGAIWRAQRVLAVGDPMQLTPVVTVPRQAQEDLAASFSVAEEWVPSTTSVQQVTDRLGRYGTTLTNGPEPLWVSAPLRVHRRCAEPMFSICNDIAYEGLMVSAVTERHDPVAQLPASHWLHVAATDTGSHLQRAQIEKLRTLLDYLKQRGVPMSEVIAVSPFKAVATALSRLRRDYPGLVAGTVHTAQGKEASVVFFVLGGDPKRPGAKVWAAATPNLVNVAVSRAKHRLYVIGDRQAWRSYPYFDHLDEALTKHKQGQANDRADTQPDAQPDAPPDARQGQKTDQADDTEARPS